MPIHETDSLGAGVRACGSAQGCVAVRAFERAGGLSLTYLHRRVPVALRDDPLRVACGEAHDREHPACREPSMPIRVVC